MVLRAVLFIFITSYLPSSTYYANHLCASVMFVAMAAASVHQFQIGRERFSLILGRAINKNQVALSMIIAILLLMLTFGESAIFTKILANYDVEKAYILGKYHPEAYSFHPFFSPHILTFIAFSVIFPAIFEEFFFRGLVFRSINATKPFFLSAVATAIIFTAIHFSKTIYIGTFIFSVVLSYLYATTRSLLTCMIVHATFNLLAFTNQHYADFHRIRKLTELNEWHHWTPEIVMFWVAIIAFGCLIFKFRDTIKNASLPALPPLQPSDQRQW